MGYLILRRIPDLLDSDNTIDRLELCVEYPARAETETCIEAMAFRGRLAVHVGGGVESA